LATSLARDVTASGNHAYQQGTYALELLISVTIIIIINTISTIIGNVFNAVIFIRIGLFSTSLKQAA
jgi:Flp pilus assembly pilin Flp